MTTEVPDDSPIRFPGWELRPAERRVLVDGQPVAVGGRAYDVLLALVRRRDRVLRKEELLQAAWPGRVVEENNLSVQVAALRKVLGPSVIVTVAGVGYRLGVTTREDGLEPATPSGLLVAMGPRPLSAGRRADELVGRDEELERLAGLVGLVPLLTLVGAGGVGKTTLAREAFARRAALQLEIAVWIDLAPVRDGAGVTSALAKGLGISLNVEVASPEAVDALASGLSRQRALVALDNCEQVRDAVAGLLRVVMDRAPGVRWLATSQVPLHVPGESVDRLAPLTVPDGPVSPEQALEYGAIALFARRAAASDGRFRLDASTVEAGCRICRALDGLPLALEMAAARVATLGLKQVVAQIDQRLRLGRGRQDTPQRQRTIADLYEWSHELLTPSEQAVFRRLEPFLGGFRAAQAIAVVADPDDEDALDDWTATDALAALVDKSLVQRRADDDDRFQLLESARDYARARLQACGEADRVRRRHAEALADWFESAEDDAEALSDAEWNARYQPERANLGAALDWAAANGPADLLARLVSAFTLLDTLPFAQAEIVHRALALDRLEQAEPALRARAFMALSAAHYSDGSRETATELARRAHALFVACNDPVGAYRALTHLVRLYESRPGTQDVAARTFRELQALDDRHLPMRTRLTCLITGGYLSRQARGGDSLEALEKVARSAGFEALAAFCRVLITDEWLIEGRDERVADAAPRIAEACLAFPRLRAAVLRNHVLALVRMDRGGEAVGPARQALRAQPSAAHVLVDMFALGAAREGRLEDAALLHGFGQRVRDARDQQADPAEARANHETAERLARGLERTRRQHLTRLGAAMSEAEALTIALGGGPTTDASAAASPGRAAWPAVRASTT